MKKKNSKKTMSDYILLGVFILLIIIVLVLLIKVIKHKPVETTTNFKIPIIENKFSTKLSVDLKKLQDSKGAYILEIPSYHNNDVVSKNLKYILKITNNSSGNINITKNESDKNIASTEREFSLQGNFKAKKKQVDIYKIKVDGNIKEGDTLDIEISSE